VLVCSHGTVAGVVTEQGLHIVADLLDGLTVLVERVLAYGALRERSDALHPSAVLPCSHGRCTYEQRVLALAPSCLTLGVSDNHIRAARAARTSA